MALMFLLCCDMADGMGGVVWCGGAEDKYVIFLLYCMSQAAVNGDSEVDDVGRKLRVQSGAPKPSANERHCDMMT